MKLLPYYIMLFEKIYLYFSIGNGQPREPALSQLYRHIFVPYAANALGLSVVTVFGFFKKRSNVIKRTEF